jgi:hypothetical protein
MRAKQVFEFLQELDIMKVHKQIKVGDAFLCIKNIKWHKGGNYIPSNNSEPDFIAGEIYEITSIFGSDAVSYELNGATEELILQELNDYFERL